MNDSIALYQDPGNNLHILDPDGLLKMDGENQFLEIVVAVINAGYSGIALDSQSLSNGRYLIVLGGNPNSIEFKIIQRIQESYNTTNKTPTIQQTLIEVRETYKKMAVGNDK